MPKVIHHLFTDEAKARRRAKDRIISGFAEVAADERLEDIKIETVLEKAEVSKSTFDKCFHSIESLFQDTAKKLVQEVFPEVRQTVKPNPDIAILVATKTRLGIRLMIEVPVLAKIALKIRWPVRDTELKILKDIKIDVEEGIKQGRFADMPSSIGVNLVFSTLKSALQEILSTTSPTDYEEQAIYQMLVGLGVDAESALKISKMPFSELPPLPNNGIAGKVLRLIASDRHN